MAGCICDRCPGYTECMRAAGELVFCIRGKTPDCMFDRRVCLCPTCPLCPEKGTVTGYYCARGKVTGVR
jgi:hypothetical protein